MNIYDEALFGVRGDLDLAVGERVLVVDDRAVHIAGHGGLTKMSEEEIVFRRKKRTIAVLGEKLQLVELTPDEGYVLGRIRAVEYRDEK